jgi:hypothetical protein
VTQRPLRALELFITAAMLAATLWSAPAAAKDERPGDPPSSATERAEALFRKGRELSGAGKIAAAFDAYREAFALEPRYDIAGNLGRTELALGRHRDAAEHLTFALEHLPKDSTQEQRERVLELVREARQHVGAARVSVDVAGAELAVDGRAIGSSPLVQEIFLEPGAHVISARSADGASTEARVVAVAGSTSAVDLVLAAAAKPPAAPASPPVPPPTAPTPAATAGPSTLVWVLAGGALVGLGAGATFTVLSEMAASDAAALAQPGGPSACLDPGLAVPCAELRGALEDRDTFGNAAIVGFGAAGAFAMGAVLVHVLDGPPEKSGARLSLHPVTGSWNGVTASGRF